MNENDILSKAVETEDDSGLTTQLDEYIYGVVVNGFGEFEEDWTEGIETSIALGLVLPEGIYAEEVLRRAEEAGLMDQFIDSFQDNLAVQNMNMVDSEFEIDDGHIVLNFVTNNNSGEDDFDEGDDDDEEFKSNC